MNRSLLAGLTVVVLGNLLIGSVASAQMNITQEQIRLFQSLPPAQQQQIMRQLGIDPGSMMVGESSADIDDSIDSFDIPWTMPAEEFEGVEVLRIEGGDTIVVTTKLKEDLDSTKARAFMQDVNRSRFLGSFLLKLDKRGALALKGVEAIPLAGLSADEVAIRLGSEPLLSDLDIDVTILPLTPMGEGALEPFGYRLFGDYDERRRNRELTSGSFDTMPTDSIPVPRDYVLGPGDEIHVTLYGNENYEVSLAVGRDGTINFPRLGPRSVAGLTFGELKEEIEQRVDEQLIGTETAITMGRLRSIRVFVVGDVKRPGAFTVSSLARITNALFYAGGITEIGSLRRIKLKRDGELVQTLDLYDLLLNGDTRNDAQLRANDVIFVPPVDSQVAIDGEIKRPAIYELRNERTLGQVIELAGGMSPAADATAVQLRRVNQRGTRDIETLDVLNSSGAGMTVQSGDFVMIFPVVEDLEEAIFLSGHTPRAGMYEWEPGMRLLDILPADSYLLPKADIGYLLIRRESGSDRRTEVLSTDLDQARANPQSSANIVLQPRDRITVFELGIARSAAMAEILRELEAQATRDESFKMVEIGGQVRAPGAYPLESGMRVSDLLRAGGGLSAAAYTSEAEMRRFVVGPTGARTTALLTIDLTAVIAGDETADILLEPYDYLNVKETPAWGEQFTVEILGEVRFPGNYPMRRGETLRSIIERAGGLTDLAFPAGSVFTREVLRKREAEQLQTLASRLEADLTGLALQAAADPSSNSQQAVSIGQSLLEQLRTSEPTGRLVIDLGKVINGKNGDQNDIELRNGDKLMVPLRSQEVMVLGEVQYATSHLFTDGRGRNDYLDLSGGLTANADPKRIYVVRANGAVVAAKNSQWFRGGQAMRPGDTIVVPMKTDRMPSLVQWSSITQIIYNMAIAVAAVNSF